jgi:acetylornithine deacetylase/succinyl-diaminopimelate desuccinylase-like protein
MIINFPCSVVRPLRLLLLALCLPLWLQAAPGSGSRPAPDFAAAHQELIEMLTGFIRVDTSNPPGNETAGAEYLKRYLDQAGIPSEILEKERGRGNLIARLRGNGTKKPLLLMGHIDVVGVEREKWSVDPFAGVIRNGFLYGRGAVDDKGMTSVCLQVMLLLHRLQIPLERDVIFLAEAGEEGTTHVGIDFLVREHWEKIESEFALNEGGGFREVDGKVQYLGVATAEKVPRPILLSARGTSGHGSRPTMDNAITHLAMAVAKAGNWQAPMRLNETTRTFFERLASISPPEEAFLFRNLEDPVLGPMVEERIRAVYPAHNAVLRTTLSPTLIKGGFRANVIPGDALATLDVRALPDEDMSALVETLTRLINDPAVEVIQAGGSRPAAPPSRLDTELFHALERVQRHLFPDAITVPRMTAGATDSAQLRAKGIQAYGIGPVATEEDAARLHGNDERISIEGLRPFLEFVWMVVLEIAAVR